VLSRFFVIFFLPLFIVTGLILHAEKFDAPPSARTFLDRQARLIGVLDPKYDGLRIWTDLRDIPAAVIAATLDQEDRWFYWHRGVNPLAVAQALTQAFMGKSLRGGSTISQQLAKNLVQEKTGQLSPRTVASKIHETILALGLEISHSKNWILERYLNTAYYGKHSHGIASAARVYFGKTLRELNPDEIRKLVSLPKAPTRGAAGLTPTQQPAEWVGRHFVEFAGSQTTLGPQVSTTLDLDLQKKLEVALPQVMTKQISEDPLLNAAAVVLDVASGDVLAMVGSRAYLDDALSGRVNAAVALRQPGSTLKPFTYFAAFAKGYQDQTHLNDEPSSFFDANAEDPDTYVPQNFDRRFHGETTIREALANSYNVPAVLALNAVGLSFYHELLRRFGITQYNLPPNHYGLAITLGSGETTLLDLTNAYATLARGGHFKPWRILMTQPDTPALPVIENADKYASMISHILMDDEARLKSFGYNENLRIQDRAVAVKTGTSHGHRDAWAVGYTDRYAVGVWIGHSDNTPLNKLSGASGAGPFWHAAMETLLRNDPKAARAIVHSAYPKITTPESATPDDTHFLRILSPLPNARYRLHPDLPIDNQTILARIQSDAREQKNLIWSVDGVRVATTQGSGQIWLAPTLGKHQLTVREPGGLTREVVYSIVAD